MIKGLYIHIPFCKQICLYCDFCKLVADNDLQNQYIQSLIKEIDYYKSRLQHLETIYIGGGTPSSLSEENLHILFSKIHEITNVKSLQEFTIEANPNDITQEFVKILNEYGVNRISIGVQTIHEEHLKLLKRTHSKADVIQAIQRLRDHSITNINLDFIYSIPGQQIQDIQSDLQFIKQVHVPHISYYSLIIEEKTELHYLISQHKIELNDEDLEADFEDEIHNTMESLGYHRYEISNFSKEHRESLHNLLYWDLEEYLGVGLHSSSQFDNKRFKNTSRISEYIQQADQNNFPRIEEDCNLEMEYLLMGLRKTQGINVIDFQTRFHTEVFKAFPNLQKHLDNGLLLYNQPWLKFSNKGLDLSNQVYLDIV